MDTNTTFYDSANGHRLKLVNARENGICLYDDQEDGSRVVCHHNEVDLYPRINTPFEPIPFNKEREDQRQYDIDMRKMHSHYVNTANPFESAYQNSLGSMMGTITGGLLP